MVWFTCFAVVGGLMAVVAARPVVRGYGTSGMVYDHFDMEASPELKWLPCFDERQATCALLQVPLDYANPNAGTTNIAFTKWTSYNESTQDILFNPGGPGIGGIGYVNNELQAEYILEVLGSDYNLISFDPRGVNRSGPALSCFPGELARHRPNYTEMAMTAPLSESYMASKAYDEFCTKANAETEAKYAGTVAVTQDMAHFIDLNHAQKGLEGKALLNYYGVSYGTTLGQTFAALFPDRVGRMILASNMDSAEYYTGAYQSSISDTDAAFRSFFEYCHKGGPEQCAFYGNSTTPEEMETRYLAALRSLRESPLIVAEPSDPLLKQPEIITETAVMQWAFRATYEPLTMFPKLARGFAAIENGDGAAFARVVREYPPIQPPKDVFKLIVCIDAHTNYPIKTFQDFLGTREAYIKESHYGGPTVALANLMNCAGVNITPPQSQQFPGFPAAGTQTLTPILFVNNLRDPITPLVSAHKSSARFPGSVVLAQDATGHGASGSRCIDDYTLAYMADASLPPKDTTCQPDVVPFMTISKQ
ncbi:TAP-like protein-domain-containing protein [Massariosphaeria phaeospora]|uniref:TAP-like protein-domain-containing protein n=1 Tax=Massariosphaeria phaeospora TaxID=100035 RepID=A0A7C8M399_9PLEO|nr:TAP-like protein-domain-containing protein [Massariosphaeria phaeospora]